MSTDDQVEQSPDAQRRRCAEYAAQKNLGPVKFLSDEGQSGKDLERPAMQELVGLIEADQVTNLIVWRMDRLSRDSGDTSRLLRLFEQHCVNVHSLNEGDLETGSASGRFTAGLHGLLANPSERRSSKTSTSGTNKLFVPATGSTGPDWLQRCRPSLVPTTSPT
nr:recombinase family protein [Candidatus Microthrix sp.]